jgi:hypothetical protein
VNPLYKPPAERKVHAIGQKGAIFAVLKIVIDTNGIITAEGYTGIDSGQPVEFYGGCMVR